MNLELFGEPAKDGLVLTSGGGDMLTIWKFDRWRATGCKWRVEREIPLPLRISGMSVCLVDECDT